MTDCDVLIIGAGHNGLVCAGYLAKAGYKVIVVERRHTVGGAVVTEEIIPGYKFDLGGSAHILIHHTPIVADLDLARFGLDYIDIDPLFFAPFPDGSSVTIWKDLDRTCASIAAISPADAEAYRAFIQRWQPLAEGMVRAFLEPPTPINLIKNLVMRTSASGDSLLNLSAILRGYGQVLRSTFQNPRIQAIIGWMAAQSGPPPGEPLSAPFALWHPMYHVSGIKRPRGGSGMLTQAIARLIQAHGGHIIAGAPVERILTYNGKAIGARTTGGIEIRARAVVSAATCELATDLV
jgi:phytoene dehydrogenase-like protein